MLVHALVGVLARVALGVAIAVVLAALLALVREDGSFRASMEVACWLVGCPSFLLLAVAPARRPGGRARSTRGSRASSRGASPPGWRSCTRRHNVNPAVPRPWPGRRCSASPRDRPDASGAPDRQPAREQRLGRASFDASLPSFPPAPRWHARASPARRPIARTHEASVDAFYVFSGDGTYNEVLNGVTGQVPLGFIPGGGTSVLRARARARQGTLSSRRVSPRAAPPAPSGSVASRAGDSPSTRASVSTPSSCGGSTRSGGATTVAGRETARSCERRSGSWVAPREVPDALEIEGIGRAAFALVANCDPYTYAGGCRCGWRAARRSTSGSTSLPPSPCARSACRACCST